MPVSRWLGGLIRRGLLYIHTTPLSLFCLHDDPSPLKVCNSHMRCTSSVSSVICSDFPSHTSSSWLSVGLHSVSTVRQFPASLVKSRRTVAVSVLGYLAYISNTLLLPRGKLMHSHMLHISLFWLHNITHNNDTVVNPPNSNV